jgi:hypothetical protein
MGKLEVLFVDGDIIGKRFRVGTWLATNGRCFSCIRALPARGQTITRAALELIKNSGTVLEVEESLYVFIKK